MRFLHATNRFQQSAMLCESFNVSAHRHRRNRKQLAQRFVRKRALRFQLFQNEILTCFRSFYGVNELQNICERVAYCSGASREMQQQSAP
jgi:hypothetical protein